MRQAGGPSGGQAGALREQGRREVAVRHGPAVDEPARLVADPTRARRELAWEPWRSDPERIVGEAWRGAPG